MNVTFNDSPRFQNSEGTNNRTQKKCALLNIFSSCCWKQSKPAPTAHSNLRTSSKQKKTTEENIPLVIRPNEPEIRPYQPKNFAPPLTDPLPYIQKQDSSEEWENKLKMVKVKRANLIETNKEVAINNSFNFSAIPCFGTYEKGYGDISIFSQITWRLPPSQLKGFPEEMQKTFGKYADENKLELFFIGFDDQMKHDSRNLVMHNLILPEYDETVGDDKEDLATYAKFRIFEPNGIQEHNSNAKISFNENNDSHMVLFHKLEGSLLISPNNAKFLIQNQAEYCSFYVGAEYREQRACVFYAIINRKESSTWSACFDKSENLYQFKELLNENKFLFTDNINKILKHYN